MEDPLALFERANDAFIETDTASLSDEELGELLVGWQRQMSRAATGMARAVAAYDVRKAYRSDGSRSAAARLARETKSSPAKMRGHVSLGRRLRLMPKVAAALVAGEIAEEHARLLGQLAASQRKVIANAFVESEDQLLGFARDLEFDEFVKALAYWEQCADPDGVEDTATDQREARRLHLSETIDGMWVLDGLLDPVSGTIVATALKRLEKKLFDDDWADAKTMHGEDTRLEDLARTPAQRRADALVEMAERAMAMPKHAKRPRPLISVYIGYETFTGRLCELSTGRVVAPGQLLPLLTKADIERVVFDGPNRVIELGKRTRFFTGGLRRAIQLRDRQCAFPGCNTPAEDCDIDHVVEYEDGGLTVQENGRAGCGPHNRRKHNHKKKQQRRRKKRRKKRTNHKPTASKTGDNGREPPPTGR